MLSYSVFCLLSYPIEYAAMSRKKPTNEDIAIFLREKTCSNDGIVT